MNDPSLNTETGLNTQNELAEKLEFFKQLEQEKSNLDYNKLNEMLDEGTSATDRVRADDLLQATGAELGNSIFNATGSRGTKAQVIFRTVSVENLLTRE